MLRLVRLLKSLRDFLLGGKLLVWINQPFDGNEIRHLRSCVLESDDQSSRALEGLLYALDRAGWNKVMWHKDYAFIPPLTKEEFFLLVLSLLQAERRGEWEEAALNKISSSASLIRSRSDYPPTP
jgi:hypothetical protein